jgi:hypothetical protein
MPESRPDEAPVLDLLASMTADSLEASSLDPGTLMAVRLAAIAAVDAPPVSYALNLEAAAAADIDADDIRGVLTAIAPIVGTAHRVGDRCDRRRACDRARGRDAQTLPPG